ncbi:MAG: hypothetical protein VW989_14800, partial [Rhodobiaceae bacterium]
MPAQIVVVPTFDVVFLEDGKPAQIIGITYRRIGHAAVKAAIGSHRGRVISTGSQRNRAERENGCGDHSPFEGCFRRFIW